MEWKKTSAPRTRENRAHDDEVAIYGGAGWMTFNAKSIVVIRHDERSARRRCEGIWALSSKRHIYIDVGAREVTGTAAVVGWCRRSRHWHWDGHCRRRDDESLAAASWRLYMSPRAWMIPCRRWTAIMSTMPPDRESRDTRRCLSAAIWAEQVQMWGVVYFLSLRMSFIYYIYHILHMSSAAAAAYFHSIITGHWCRYTELLAIWWCRC